MSQGNLGAEDARADAWDAVSDERQRLADERERLADEREQLADEREQLADEHERWLDQRYAELVREGVIDEVLDEELAQAEAEGRIARAEARVDRSVLERDWARHALQRRELERGRLAADSERADRRSVDATSPDEWTGERRDFVAIERDRGADLRDESEDRRESAADRREYDANVRDQEQRQREERLEGLSSRRGADDHQPAGHPDLVGAELRTQAERQRRSAARSRLRAKSGRAQSRAEGRASSLAPEPDGPLLASQFVHLLRELFSTPDFVEVVERVLGFGLECLPAFVAAGVTFSDVVLPVRRFATDVVASQLDTLQFETGQGPSPAAVESAEPVHARSFDRWESLSRRAAELDIGDAVAYDLTIPRGGAWLTLGVLTFYAQTKIEFDDGTKEVGSMLAAYIAVAAGLEHDRHDLSRREAALHRALNTRDVIGQAKGILMERQRIPAGEAFDTLRRTSQRLNLRLHEIATHVAETGEIPTT